jgi:hypothetical protein
MKVTDCRVEMGCGYIKWTCTICGKIADEDFDYEDFVDIPEPEEKP